MIDRKEIKRRYKATVQPMGVYRITSLNDGKIFIGSSKSIDTIFNSVRFQLKNGRHPNRDMQRDFLHHGEASFAFEVIDRLEPKEDPKYDYSGDLLELEKLWLEKLQPFDEKGYNSRKTAV